MITRCDMCPSFTDKRLEKKYKGKSSRIVVMSEQATSLILRTIVSGLVPEDDVNSIFAQPLIATLNARTINESGTRGGGPAEGAVYE